MQTLTVKSIESKGHQEIKVLFWILFGSTRGAPVRTKIVKLLKNKPYNTNQLSKELSIDYKAVKHHMDILEKNNLIDKLNVAHISTYFFSPLLKLNQKCIQTQSQIIILRVIKNDYNLSTNTTKQKYL